MARWLCSRTHWLVVRGLEESAVEAARGAIVDVLDRRGLPELGSGLTAGEPAIGAEGDFAIDEETEPIGMWHLGRLWIVLQLD
jgi:hypothetical protein